MTNDGIEELKEYIPEMQKRKDDDFFEKLCLKFLEKNGIQPLKLYLDSPYMVVKMTIEDFKKNNIIYIGGSPNWDTNWGHDFYCIKAKFHWSAEVVSCVYQNENESLNQPRFFREPTIMPAYSIRGPPNLYDW